MYLKRKYQVGGVVYTPYLPAQAGTAQGTTSTSASSSTSSTPEKISGTMKKEVIDILKENGIPSDVDQFLQYANNFLDKSKNLSSYSLFGGNDDDYDMSDLIKVQSLANKVKFNKALYDKANENLTKQYAWSEVALTDKGQMYVYDTEKGEVTKIDPSTYHENSDKYQALTNSDVLSYREQSQPFDNSSLNDLQNAVGMKSITDYLREIIKAFGKDTIEGYATKDKDAILSGFHFLMENGPDGFYKVKSEEQLRDVNRALTYLYNSLPENMKQLLRAKTAAEGGDPNGKDRFELLVQALSEHTSRDYSATFDKPATEYDPLQSGKKGGSSGGSEQLTQNNYLQQLGNMRLTSTKATIVPKASQIFDTGAMVVNAYTAGAPVDKQLDVLGPMSIKDFRIAANGAKAGDLNSITFGNRILNPDEYDKVMYDGSSELNVVELPYKRDPATGKIMPDFDKLKSFNEIQNVIRNNPNISTSEYQQLLKSKGISPDEIDNNTMTLRDTMAFMTVSAYASKDTVSIPGSMKSYLEHLDNRSGKNIIDLYNNVVVYGTANPTKQTKAINKGVNTPERWDMYRGNIFIPMENAARAMLLSGIGEYVPKAQMTDFAARVEAREQEAAMVDYIRQNDQNYNIISQLGQFR